MMENEDNVVRLAKPVKKGIVRLLFSRFFLIALFLVLQIGIMITAYLWFREKLPHLLYVQAIFVFGMVLYLFNCGMDSEKVCRNAEEIPDDAGYFSLIIAKE